MPNSIAQAFSQPAVKSLAKAIKTYYDNRRGERMAGYRVLEQRQLLAATSTLARSTLSSIYSGCKVGAAVMAVGDAVDVKLVLDTALTFKERMDVGSYLISMALYAGILEMYRGDGTDADSAYGFEDDQGHVVHPDAEPWYIRYASDMVIDEIPPGYLSRTPFPAWTGPTDDEGRTLVHNRHLTLDAGFFVDSGDRKADIWVRGVNAVESVGYQINPTMLALVQSYGSLKLKSNKKAREGDQRIIDEATRLKADPFYHRVHMCSRGRVYLSRSPLHYQQGDISRGLLDFATSVAMTADGMDALYLHLANTEGLIKGDIDARIAHAKRSADTYRKYGNAPTEHYKKWKKAGHPWMFIRACIELATVDVGDQSRLIVEIDQSQSGLAWQAIFMEDEQLAEMTNLQGEWRDIYQEIGDNIELKVTTPEGEEIQVNADHKLNPASRPERRELAKKTILPAGYGAGVDTIAIQIAQWAKNNRTKAKYTTTLGIKLARNKYRDMKASPGITDIARRIKKAIKVTAPATKKYADTVKAFYNRRMVRITPEQFEKQSKHNAELRVAKSMVPASKDKDARNAAVKKALQSLKAKPTKDQAKSIQKMLNQLPITPASLDRYIVTSYPRDGYHPDLAMEIENHWLDGHPIGHAQLQWMLPTGFHVHIQKTETKVRKGSVYSFEKPWTSEAALKHRHKIVLQEPTDRPDFQAMTTSALADHVHSWDGALIQLIAATTEFPIAPIHDALGVHASNAWELQRKFMQGLDELGRCQPLLGLLHQDEIVGVIDAGEHAMPVLRGQPRQERSEKTVVDIKNRNHFS